VEKNVTLFGKNLKGAKKERFGAGKKGAKKGLLQEEKGNPTSGVLSRILGKEVLRNR